MPQALVNSKTILFAEDETVLRELYRTIFERAGFSLIVAGDGQEALRIASEYLDVIDLLVSDVQMPGMNGFELAEAFAERFPNCAVLLITMDSALLEWWYKGRVYKILHKIGAVEAVLEFLRTCVAVE